jgi:hypothetical protein
MNSHMNKTQLLDLIQAARADFETLLAGIPEAWMTEPGVEGEWSIKDIIAHIAWASVRVWGWCRPMHWSALSSGTCPKRRVMPRYSSRIRIASCPRC